MKRIIGALALAAALVAHAAPAIAQTAPTLYTRALGRERELRDARTAPTLKQLRAAAASYEAIVRRFPTSGYSDNALWQAANLSLLAHERFGDAADRSRAVRLLEQLATHYPATSLLPRVRETLAALVASPLKPIPTTGRASAAAEPPGSTAAADRRADGLPLAIKDVKRSLIPEGVRVSIEIAGESLFRHETLEGPRRVFFDLRGTRPVADLLDATLKFNDDVVKEIRLGRHPQDTTRVVMDMEGVESYSVFTLYNPFRVIVDFKRVGPPPPAVAAAAVKPVAPAPLPALTPTRPPKPEPIAELPPVIPSRPAPIASTLPPPLAPSLNSNGQFSLARQLGLGVSRIVIDAGHGGHDPGARANGLTEADLVLDVALRLRKLLQKQPGVEVAMTRDSNVFIPLEERTAFANKEEADLFLSIHANASRNTRAHGVETYFLNFATNPDAAAVAARENATSAKSMHSLPDIVRAIALNNKIDESRDFADKVQKSMVKRMSARNKQLKDLGVKQAPFVVLVGAGMPSVLAEISFVTNKQDGALLKTPAYRQVIAEALLDAVLTYQGSLKKMRVIASQE
jgi:N-acetylmuramoyl-L-alanine amidase